jgi:hypothetical protein
MLGSGNYCSNLWVVNGNPAIAYEDGSGMVWFRRADDVIGDAWGSPVQVGVGNTDASLVVANGVPAVCWYRSSPSSLVYARALDANGASWPPTPQTLIPSDPGNYYRISLISGNPALLYQTNANQLIYMPALDADGVTWGLAEYIDDGYIYSNSKLADFPDGPAVSYYDGVNKDLKFAYRY